MFRRIIRATIAIVVSFPMSLMILFTLFTISIFSNLTSVMTWKSIAVKTKAIKSFVIGFNFFLIISIILFMG